MWENTTITLFLCLAGFAILIFGLSRTSVLIEHWIAGRRWVPIVRLWHGITTKEVYKPLSPDELKSAIDARAYDLWVETGQPARWAGTFRLPESGTEGI
jgi:hypothetical protein